MSHEVPALGVGVNQRLVDEKRVVMTHERYTANRNKPTRFLARSLGPSNPRDRPEADQKLGQKVAIQWITICGVFWQYPAHQCLIIRPSMCVSVCVCPVAVQGWPPYTQGARVTVASYAKVGGPCATRATFISMTVHQPDSS